MRTTPDGIVEASTKTITMLPDYQDEVGDHIDGPDGNDDKIFTGNGDNYVDAGLGDDVVSGGTGSDTLLGSSGEDTLCGGRNGDDVLFGSTDDVTSAQDYVAGEHPAEADVITLTKGVEHTDIPTEIQGLDDHSLGTFTPAGGTPVAFGPGADYLFSDILDGTSPGGGLPAVGPLGAFSITDGDESGQIGDISFANFEAINFSTLPCFTPGTLIGTARGEVPVELLREGDQILTRDNGLQDIRWVGQKTLDRRTLNAAPDLQPVLVRKGSLGNGLPERDMLVSPNHRLLIANEQSALYYDEREVLVAAKHLVNGKGIRRAETLGATYIHFMFDHHEVVLSDGAWTESFQPGDGSLRGIGEDQRSEIFALFPELREKVGQVAYGAARRALKRHEAELLVLR